MRRDDSAKDACRDEDHMGRQARLAALTGRQSRRQKNSRPGEGGFPIEVITRQSQRKTRRVEKAGFPCVVSRGNLGDAAIVQIVIDAG